MPSDRSAGPSADRAHGPPLFVDVPSGRFHYRAWLPDGGADRTAVLLHGNADTSASWGRVGPALAAHGTAVFAPDLRGHGASVRPPEGPYDPRTVADDVTAFIAALRLDTPLLLGHCWGALIALVLAAGQAHRPAPALSALVLEEPLTDPAFSANRAFRTVFDKAVRMPREDLEPLIDTFQAEWHPEDRRSTLDGLLGADPGIASRITEENVAFGPVLPLLSRVPVPVLLLRADPACGGIVDDADFTAAARLLPPGSRAWHLPGVPHGIHQGAFATFMSRVTEFLRSGTPGPQTFPAGPAPAAPPPADPARPGPPDP